MRPVKLKEMTIDVMGVPITVKGAVYYPPEKPTSIDPPEAEFAEWEGVYVGDVDVSELFALKHNAQLLEETICKELE